MFLGQLTTLLSLLSGARFHTGSGRPGLLGPPPQLWDATNQTRALGQGTLGSQGQSSALSSWKAFLGLQKTGLLGRGSQHHGQEVAPTVSLPLDPQEVAQEMCKAVPYTQVRVGGGRGGWCFSMGRGHKLGSCTDLGSSPVSICISPILSFLLPNHEVCLHPGLPPKSIFPLNSQRAPAHT